MVETGVVLSIVELLCGLGAAAVAVAAWRHRRKPAGFPVFVMAVAGCGYAFINGFDSLVPHATLTLFFGHMRGPLGAIIAVAVFYTAVEYTNRSELQRWWILALGPVFVFVDAVAFLTNPIHQWLMYDLSTAGGFSGLNTPLVWVHYTISFAFVLGGLILLGVKFSNRGIHRLQTGAMLVGIGIAFGFFFLEAFVSFHPNFDTAVVGIFLASLVLLWAIDSAGLLETVPVARETLMDTMDDFIVALDADDRVIDANASAMAFLDTDERILNRHATDVFSEYPNLVEEFGSATRANHEFSLTHEDQRRHYRLTISPITHETDVLSPHSETKNVGRLIVVSDITEQRRKEEELALLKQVFARVLRHNMRNDLNVIKGNVRLLSENIPESDEKFADLANEYTDNLLEMSEKARDLESIIESPRARTCVDLADTVDHAIVNVSDSYPDAEIKTRIHRPCYVTVHKDLQRAIENLLENACRHDTDPPTTIDISTDLVDETVELSIVDDGPGISDHELEVIETETETTLHHGSGLGLWIVNWVVNRSKGDIDLEGRPDGTRVTLTLFLAKDSDDAAEEASFDESDSEAVRSQTD